MATPQVQALPGMTPLGLPETMDILTATKIIQEQATAMFTVVNLSATKMLKKN